LAIKIRIWLKWGALVSVAIGGLALAMFTFVTVMNADMYGRLIETQVATGVGKPTPSEDQPTIRLVLHRLPSDENAVEASILLIADGSVVANQVREGKTSTRATGHDGSSFQPFGIQSDVTLDATSANVQPEEYSSPR